MCNISCGEGYCVSHLFWTIITIHFRFLVDILFTFVTISKEVNIFRHWSSLASNVVGVLNLAYRFTVVPSSGQRSARTSKLAPNQKTFHIQKSINGSTELPLNNISRPGSSLSILTLQQSSLEPWPAGHAVWAEEGVRNCWIPWMQGKVLWRKSWVGWIKWHLEYNYRIYHPYPFLHALKVKGILIGWHANYTCKFKTKHCVFVFQLCLYTHSWCVGMAKFLMMSAQRLQWYYSKIQPYIPVNPLTSCPATTESCVLKCTSSRR